MAAHSHFRPPADEPTDFGPRTRRLIFPALVAAGVGFLIAVVWGFFAVGDPENNHRYQRFLFSWLVGLSFFMSISLGALFFVLIQHVTRAGWSVNVRRLAENLAALLPILGALSLPILLSVALRTGTLYPWALPLSAAHDTQHGPHPAATDPKDANAKSAGNQQTGPDAGADKGSAAHPAPGGAGGGHGTGHHGLDSLTLEKRPFLNPGFFLARVVTYFVIWSVIALYFRRESVRQDVDADVVHSLRMQKWAALSLVLFGLTLTFAAFDLIMSLDAHWYSTMFGVYFFAGCAVSFFATMIVSITALRRMGYFREAITVEHYHDLGKFMFGFTFFYGYIAFSQYMLLWYANLPETTTWLARRGATTAHPTAEQLQTMGYADAWRTVVPDGGQQWRVWVLLLLFGKFVIPFGALLSRHVKRNIRAVTAIAIWLLIFQFVDIVWMILPELRKGWTVHPMDICAMIAIGGVCFAAWLRITANARLRPAHDPRLEESAVFVNV